MARKYILPRVGNGLVRLVFPSAAAPRTPQASMINSPRQATNAIPVEEQNINYPYTQFRRALYSTRTVQTIPVRQQGLILEVPHAPIGAKTVERPDQRLGEWTYPVDGARQSYVFGEMAAPARLQSVPGYTAYTRLGTRAEPTYPKQALKAPSPARGGGGCK